MKKLLNLFFVGILIVGMNSCNTDPITTKQPSIVFEPTTDYISTDAVVDAGSTIKTKVKAVKGNSDLNVFTITRKKYSEGTTSNLDPTGVLINGSAIASNPILILAASELAGFTYDITFPVSTTADTISYSFLIKDKDGETSNVSFTIYTRDNSVLTLTGKKLFNKAGKIGTGGIDLQTGTSTNSTDLIAEIIDVGIDVNGNWKKQFEARNPAETTIRNAPAGLNFNTLTKSDIMDAFDAGTVASSPVTPALNNVYIIKSGIFYFAVKITDIVNTPTLGDNLDYFQMDIKQ